MRKKMRITDIINKAKKLNLNHKISSIIPPDTGAIICAREAIKEVIANALVLLIIEKLSLIAA